MVIPILINKEKNEFNYAAFHLRMIKNTSITKEKNLTFLRINFHNPQNAAASKDVVMPALLGHNALVIKELTLKSENGKSLTQVNIKVKEAIRLMKQKDT